VERVAIVGTAPSWQRTPWQDAGLHIVSLNDAYQINGFERADEWYDIHPIDHFHFVPDPTPQKKPQIYQHEIPVGHYVRPQSHLNWLATQTIPVWLHPDHATQHPASATWPSARAFPKAEIEAHFGRYFTSTPAWMLAHALLQGAREVHIYGIHLSTESEYIEQRPNFEYLMGCLLGRGKRTMTVVDGLRYYDSSDGRLVLPEASPVLASNFQYAFETSPRRHLEPLKWALHKATVKRERTIAALKSAPRWSPWVTVLQPDDAGQPMTRRVTRSTLQAELWEYDALVADCQEQLQRAQHEASHA
jgi:hypothetical protein